MRIANEGGWLTLSELSFDSELFGARVGRIDSVNAQASGFRSLYEAATEAAIADGYRQLVRRIRLEDQQEMWALIAVGFRPVDVGVTLRHGLRARDLPRTSLSAQVRPATDADIDVLSERLKGVHRTSHFYADPFYGTDQADELHRRWLINCHRGGLADVVFVADLEGRPVGYCACKVDAATGVGSIPLVAVDPESRGRRVGRSLLSHSLSWLASRAKEARVRTQAYNVRAVNLYGSVGFRSFETDMTLSRSL